MIYMKIINIVKEFYIYALFNNLIFFIKNTMVFKFNSKNYKLYTLCNTFH